MKINFKELLKTSIYITPNIFSNETVRYKFRITELLLYLLAYTFLIVFFTVIILYLTPLKNSLFYYENSQMQTQAKKTIELEKKVIILTKELESIASTNKKLKYAYLLATSDSIDTTDAIYDSLKYEPNKNLPYGGSLLFIINSFIDKITFFQDAEKSIFIKPSSGIIINDFNPEEGHFGIDFAVSSGTSIYASSGGLVIFADFTLDDGNKIIIQHENGYITIYKHCSTILKKERDFVDQGELIGLSGNTGKNTTGPHLHFEIWKLGKPVNPKEFFIK